MQLGPGLPIINEARRFERLLALEDAFTVVYWDQRGTGLSLRASRRRVLLRCDVRGVRGCAAARPRRHADRRRDGRRHRRRRDQCLCLRAPGRSRARQSTCGATAGEDRPAPASGPEGILHAVPLGGQLRGFRNQRQLQRNGPRTPRQLGSVTRLFARRRLPTLRGIRASQAALVPELAATDLVRTMPRVGVPIVMVQGRLDQVAPGEAAQRFYDALEAPSKQLVWFEQSAHTPHLEEPERFRDVVMTVRITSATVPGDPAD
ncbi:MAG TPA: alpha/beta hydrolase [Actinomycetes bacterium]|nr:alpha/beta hydrolase [Actinomycetes bacterium]